MEPINKKNYLKTHSCKGSLESEISIKWLKENNFELKSVGWWLCAALGDYCYGDSNVEPVSMIKFCPFCGVELHEEPEWRRVAQKEIENAKRFKAEFEPDIVIAGNFSLSDIQEVKKAIREKGSVQLNTPYEKTKSINVTKEGDGYGISY